MKKYQGHISFSFEFESELNEQEAWEKVVSLLSVDKEIITDLHDADIWVEEE